MYGFHGEKKVHKTERHYEISESACLLALAINTDSTLLSCFMSCLLLFEVLTRLEFLYNSCGSKMLCEHHLDL